MVKDKETKKQDWKLTSWQDVCKTMKPYCVDLIESRKDYIVYR